MANTDSSISEVMNIPSFDQGGSDVGASGSGGVVGSVGLGDVAASFGEGLGSSSAETGDLSGSEFGDVSFNNGDNSPARNYKTLAVVGLTITATAALIAYLAHKKNWGAK